jgi:hypothetical protein
MIAVLAILLAVATVVLINKVTRQFVCPFCGGPIRRAFQKMRCSSCGRLFYLWQARSK